MELDDCATAWAGQCQTDGQVLLLLLLPLLLLLLLLVLALRSLSQASMSLCLVSPLAPKATGYLPHKRAAQVAAATATG